MIRPACALAVIPFAVVLFGIDLRKMKGDHGKLWKKSAALMITAGCVVMLYLGNYLALHIPAGWNYFERYNHVISGLLDYGMPDYETYRDEYEKIGMDETEYRMVSNYIVADPEYLPLEKLEQVLALKKRTERGMLFQPENFQKTCYTILSSAKDRYLPFLWIFLGGVVVFLHKREKLCWLLFSVVIFGEYWYMCARGRVMWRVECGIWTTAILCLAALIILERELNKRSRIGNLLVGAVAGCFALLQMGSLVYEFQNTKKGEISPEQLNVSSFFVSIEPERDVNFYMGGIITFDFHVTRSVYDIDKKYEGYYGNFAYLGGWPYSSPVNAHYSEMHGITNPVRSLLELDNCYLADNAGAEEILLDYYRTHYNADTQVEDLGIRNNIHIWRFYVPG